MYINVMPVVSPTPHRCPNCGACPNCGKYLSPQVVPWVQPWPGYPSPYIGDLPGWGWGTVNISGSSPHHI